MSGRLDWRYELENIREGMDRDLQKEVGQSIPWHVFDPAATEVDPVYDTGSTAAGRRWKPALLVPVLSAVKIEGNETQNNRGLYTVDSLRLVLSVDHARQYGLGALVFDPEKHVVDRVIYENKVFDVTEVRTRGMLTADYAVIGVTCNQVKAEELVNDPQFRQYMASDQD